MRRVKLEGQVFTRLTVLELDEVRSKGSSNAYWVCVCRCGETLSVSASNLKSGATRSCGCIKRVDITGRVYGKLTAVKYDKERSLQEGASFWVCECICGGTKSIRLALLGTYTNSCGCLNNPDITGETFGRLTAVEKLGSVWLCSCLCGNTITVRAGPLRNGNTKSCGCLHKERCDSFGSIMLHKHLTHGLSKHPTFRSWGAMKQRCLNKNHHAYSEYGGRGIGVCDRWLDFSNFVSDMGLRPDGTSLDRVDNNGGYSPENCIWSNWTKQNRNKRGVKLTEHVVKQIRLLDSQGVPRSEIAIRYNLTPGHVYLIVTGKRWADQLDT